ncbi:hypothetical protein DFH07DRAFT_780974 [Mycena maculata]|uniref:Myb/SANT-like domain-containing protein n=1 Tax=Mycena maculata TaxID=230809 RepID=A0AAD7I256_9AGAR|nr:hypothetical protein DFH07DRAFT_780974 [Mycena maculata]
MAPDPVSDEGSPDAAPALPTEGNSSWSHNDITVLLEYLVQHKAEAGDGCSFKATTFRGAVIAVNAIRTKGGPKDHTSCATKYSSVIMTMSGWAWDETKGVDVTSATQGTWDAFVAANPLASRFRNRGWPYYHLFLPLMPTKAKGTHAFRPAMGVVAQGGESPPRRSPSPDWDQQQLEADFARKRSAGHVEPNSDDLDNDDTDLEHGMGPPPSSSPAPSLSSKRAAAQPVSANHRKKPRLSGSSRALQDIASAATDFNGIMGNFRAILAGPAQAPVDVVAPAAVMAAQKEKWLPPKEHLAFINFISDKDNMNKADTYNALEDEEIRIPWVIDQLREALGIIIFHPLYADLG